MNAANSLTDVVTQITSGLLGDLTGVDIDLTEVTNQLNLLNNLQSLGGANFTSDQTLSADGSYISADVSDGLGLVVAQNVSTILRDLQSAISSLEASGSGIASNVVATAINAALTPVKGTLNTAINVALPLLNAGGSLVNQLLDASVLGSTTVTLPTTVSAPQNLTQNLDARFVGSVIQANAVDVNLISTGNGSSTIYFAPADSSAVTAPNITNVTGTSTNGYTVTGTADPNVTVEIRNQSGTTIATATTDDTGAFTANIPAGQATAEESLTAVAISNGTESTGTNFETPGDPTGTVATPTVDNVTGNSTAGYTVTGTAENGTTIEVRNADGTVIGTGTTDPNGDYTVTIDPGVVNPGDTINVVGIDNNGNESQPTQVVVPADGEDIIIVAPTIDSVIGTSTTGYEVKGKAEPNRIVQISNTRVQTEEAAELVQPVMLRSLLATAAPVSPLAATPVIATTTADAQGNFTVQLAVGAAQAQESLFATATDGQGNYSLATLFSTPADPTSPTNPDDNGTGSGGTGTGTGTTPGAGTGTGTTPGVGLGMGNGTGTGVSGMGTTGAGLNNGGYGSGFGTNGTGFGGMYYGSGSGYTGSGTSYPSTGEKENVTAGIFGGLLALLASLGIIKRNRSKE